MDGGAWWAAVHGVAKSRTRLLTQATGFKNVQCVASLAARGSRLPQRPAQGAWV